MSPNKCLTRTLQMPQFAYDKCILIIMRWTSKKIDFHQWSIHTVLMRCDHIHSLMFNLSSEIATIFILMWLFFHIFLVRVCVRVIDSSLTLCDATMHWLSNHFHIQSTDTIPLASQIKRDTQFEHTRGRKHHNTQINWVRDFGVWNETRSMQMTQTR